MRATAVRSRPRATPNRIKRRKCEVGQPRPRAHPPTTEQRQQPVVPKEETPESQYARRAREGNLDAISEILRNVSLALDCATNFSMTRREKKQENHWIVQSVARCVIPWPYAEYLAEALQKASNANLTELSPNTRQIEGSDAVRLLGLGSRNRGRPKGTKTHDEIPLAALYWLAVGKGFTPAGAKKLLQDLLQNEAMVDRRTIERAAKSNSQLKKHADGLLERIISDAPTMYSRALKALLARTPGK